MKIKRKNYIIGYSHMHITIYMILLYYKYLIKKKYKKYLLFKILFRIIFISIFESYLFYVI
ncbi:hypothetical protein PFMC_00117 [Plasmodium falciparum CAMP/Malaysia]|uniref:Uncharacterized protein n=1 Tax=Plasmodium falciparum (isolate Camp / Malaysia) TaxID=5835 RepID=A0A024XFK2_PLAFC|nr:hypothetical protein PFMC_00117 [Plasmodium falciparum CAMP/Malaysia]